MRNSLISYRRIILNIIFLIAMSVATCLCVVYEKMMFLLVCLPLLTLSVFRLISVYKGIIGRISFIIRAVKNDDYSFRFTENPNRTENVLVNSALNEIKDVMDEKKRLIREDEKNFELIMECANIGIMLLMKNGTVMHANSKALAFFSLPRISHIEHLRAQSDELVDILSSAIGSLTNPTKLAKTFKSVKNKVISDKTLKKYMDYLQDAFLIQMLNRQ